MYPSITLGLTWPKGDNAPYTKYQWPGFAVMLGVNLIGLIVICARRDIVWCVGAVWVCASVWSAQPKPASIIVSPAVL
jgi:hypothetical protein